jgi:hypothetical protein
MRIQALRMIFYATIPESQLSDSRISTGGITKRYKGTVLPPCSAQTPTWCEKDTTCPHVSGEGFGRTPS